MTITTFLQLQLLRITNKPVTHVSGPKRPDLTDVDYGNTK